MVRLCNQTIISVINQLKAVLLARNWNIAGGDTVAKAIGLKRERFELYIP